MIMHINSYQEVSWKHVLNQPSNKAPETVHIVCPMGQLSEKELKTSFSRELTELQEDTENRCNTLREKLGNMEAI